MVQKKRPVKNVLYLTYDGLTDPLGQSQVLPYVIGLQKKGYRLFVLSFEKKERFNKSQKDIQQIVDAEGIVWLPEMFTSSPPLLSKLWDQRKMNNRAKEICKTKNIHFLHCRSYVSAEAAIKIKATLGIPFLFDMRGFWVDERVDNGQWNLKNPLYKALYKTYKKKELRYLAEAAQIISLTEKGKLELKNTYQVSENKITVIPCCVDLAHFDYRNILPKNQEAARKKIGIPDGVPVLSYAGSLGGWYLLPEMMDFFLIFKKQFNQAIFLIITTDQNTDIAALAATKGIKESDIKVASASRNEMPLFLSLSTWSLFFIKDAYSKKASSPTKQGEIMAMGIPIICNDIGDTGGIITASQSGWVVDNLKKTNYQETIEQMQNENSKNPENIRNAAVRYFSLEDGIEKYASLYKKISEA